MTEPTTDLALRQPGFHLQTLGPLGDFADKIAKTDFVPGNLRGKPEAVLACFMTGQELGLPPMQSLRQLHVIDGKVGQAAELMRAIILERGHKIWPGKDQEFTTTRVVMYGQRKGEDEVASVTWTIEMARNAGLANKNNWKNFPRNQLTARATTELARLIFPDVIAGMGYDIDELENMDDSVVVDGEIVEEETPKRRVRSRAKPKETATPAAPIPDVPLPDDDIADAEIVEEGDPTDEDIDHMPPPKKPAATEHSRQVVKLAKALKQDHHPIVSYVTQGRTESSNDLTPDEAARVMDALRAVEEGRARVGEKDGQWFVFAVQQHEPAPEPDDEVIDGEVIDDDIPEPDIEVEGDGSPFVEDAFTSEAESSSAGGEPDYETWGADEWRDFLAEHGVRLANVLRHAAVLTKNEPNSHPIGTIQSIAGSGIAAKLAQYVKDNARND